MCELNLKWTVQQVLSEEFKIQDLKLDNIKSEVYRTLSQTKDLNQNNLKTNIRNIVKNILNNN